MYHASSIAHLPIFGWDDIGAIRSRTYNVRETGDGHLLHFHESGKPFIEELEELREAALQFERVWSGFPFHFYYSGELHFGNALFLEERSYAEYIHPNALGNRTDQAPQYTTLTIVSSVLKMPRLLALWHRYFSRLNAVHCSAVFLSQNARATQAILYHDEFTLENHVDLMIASLLFTRDNSDSTLYLGRTITIVEGVPMKKHTRMISEMFGPFTLQLKLEPDRFRSPD